MPATYTLSIWDLRKTGTATCTAAGEHWGPRQPIGEPTETDFPTIDIISQCNFVCSIFSDNSVKISVKREKPAVLRLNNLNLSKDKINYM